MRHSKGFLGAVAACLLLSGCLAPQADEDPIPPQEVPAFLPNLPPEPDFLLRSAEFGVEGGLFVFRIGLQGSVTPEVRYLATITSRGWGGTPESRRETIVDYRVSSGHATSDAPLGFEGRLIDTTHCPDSCPPARQVGVEVDLEPGVIVLRWAPTSAEHLDLSFTYWYVRIESANEGCIHDVLTVLDTYLEVYCPESRERMPPLPATPLAGGAGWLGPEASGPTVTARALRWAVYDDRLLVEVHLAEPFEIRWTQLHAVVALTGPDGLNETYILAALSDGQDTLPFRSQRLTNAVAGPTDLDAVGSFVRDDVVHLHAYRPADHRVDPATATVQTGLAVARTGGCTEFVHGLSTAGSPWDDPPCGTDTRDAR